MRKPLARLAGHTYIGAMYLALPFMPLLASLVFWRKKYVLNYASTLEKAKIHIAAMRQGPALHFFSDVWGLAKTVPANIAGECTQCGNCCMNHQCMFLEQVEPSRFLCGIYHSPFRALSNCGSFPLNQDDIERYSCPGYFVPEVQVRPITIYRSLDCPTEEYDNARQ